MRSCAKATPSRATPIWMQPIASANGRSPAAIGCAATSWSGRSISPGAEYFPTPGSLQALGLSVGQDVLAGMRLSLTHRTAARIEEEMPEAESRGKPEAWFAGCRVSELPIYLLGAEADAVALYEQLIADCIGIYFRYLDEFGDPVIVPAPQGLHREDWFRR